MLGAENGFRAVWLSPKLNKIFILFKNAGPTKRARPFGAVPFFPSLVSVRPSP